MIKYILRRLLILPILMFLVTSILFFFILQLPVEQRVWAYLPSGRSMKTEEQEQQVMEATIERYGLDKPFPVQYVKWLENLAKGDWGYSPSSRQSVLEGLKKRAPATIELMLFTLVPSVLLSLGAGGLAARHRNRLPDYLVRAVASIGWALPPFILGLVLMNVLYAWLDWFPPERLSLWADILVKSEQFHTVTGMYTVDALLNGNVELFLDAVRHLVLPGLTVGVVQWALLTRVMRSSLLEALRQDYVTTARAKGLRESQVVNLHARRNAILPVISTAGVAVPTWLSSVVIVEVIFHFNGVGRWAVRAALNLDVQVVVGFAVFSCTVAVLASLVVDILYAIVDPRVKLD